MDPPPYSPIAIAIAIAIVTVIARTLAIHLDLLRICPPIIFTFIREPFKYYFADFVRKWANPPPPYGFFLAKKELQIRGVTPSPPLRGFPRKKNLQKGLKNVFFAQKTLDFGQHFFFTDFSPKKIFKKGEKLCYLLKKHLILVQKIGYAK